MPGIYGPFGLYGMLLAMIGLVATMLWVMKKKGWF
jgi:Mg2+ and Co2+ transporter CorA